MRPICSAGTTTGSTTPDRTVSQERKHQGEHCSHDPDTPPPRLRITLFSASFETLPDAPWGRKAGMTGAK